MFRSHLPTPHLPTHHISPFTHHACPQPNVARKYRISSVTYAKLFPGSTPKFEQSLSKKMQLGTMSPRGKEAFHKLQKKTHKETKLRDQKEAREEKRMSKGGDEIKKKGRPSLSTDEKLSRKL